ncbi:hypothetical protein Bca52824_009229 [Brassica carinata]|uniref:Uncharacterized protein n=1 Tax=Brassica carinata TaxID=52824 RepID=A0A8X7WBD9_BRACI|nr:hypothetical protein Bca52824_009229 [Brassica carinata]
MQERLRGKTAWTRQDEVVDDDALEKEGEVRVDGALENTAGWRFTGSAEMPKRVPSVLIC